MTTPNEELRKQLQQIYKSGELYYRVISDTTDSLQSQAEHIATLEGDVEYLQKDIDAMCNAIPNYHWSGGAAELIAECFAERDELRAQLAALDATAPYAYTHNHEWKLRQSESVIKMVKSFQPEYGFTFPLFTRPMPAQDVTELVEALEALIESTTGVDQVSVVNDARTALSKYKGAK